MPFKMRGHCLYLFLPHILLMQVSHQILFFFSALGAFNSLVLSVFFLFFARPKKTSNYWLSALLAAIGIRVGKSVFLYFNGDLAFIYLQIGLSACFLIGPFLFYFTQSVLPTGNRKQVPSLVPISFFLGLILVFGILYPYQVYPDYWRKPVFQIINYSWGIWVALSGVLVSKHIAVLARKQAPWTADAVLMVSVFVGVAIIWFAYFTSRYTSYILGALCTSLSLYLSALLLWQYNQRKKRNVRPKYGDQQIPAEESTRIQQAIAHIFEVEKLYTQPNLTLPTLARRLNVRIHTLSQYINDNLRKNFSQFVNEYRVHEAQRLIKENPHLKMEAIADMCGFNSASTFYSAFKKTTGRTPAQYQQTIS